MRMMMMMMITEAKTNNENADPPVHICAAPTLKSSWEAVLQVSVNKYLFKSNKFLCKSFSVPTHHPRNLKLISSATVGRGGLDTEGLYYTLQPVYSSSSGSASSDPACPNSSSSSSYPNSSDPTSSSSYSSPVQYPHQFGGGGTHSSGSPAHFGNTSGTQFGGTAPGGHFGSTSSGAGGNSFGAGGPPGSGTPILHHSPLHLLSAVEPHDGGAGAHQREPQHHQGGTLLHQGSPQWGGHHHPGGTQKKRSTLVKYRYPDVLPSNNTNQNYYV